MKQVDALGRAAGLVRVPTEGGPVGHIGMEVRELRKGPGSRIIHGAVPSDEVDEVGLQVGGYAGEIDSDILRRTATDRGW